MMNTDPTQCKVNIREYRAEDQESVKCIFADGMQAFVNQAKGNLRHFMQLNIKRAISKDLATIESSYGLHTGSGMFWIAEEKQSGTIVGIIGVQRISENAAEIRRMSVVESFQRLGIGTMLLRHAEKWCLEHSFEYVTLTTLSIMTGSCRFYEAVGYIEDFRESYPPKAKVLPEESQMIHYKKWIDCKIGSGAE